jgi:DNA-binding transcriptional ArsR family regulator
LVSRTQLDLELMKRLYTEQHLTTWQIASKLRIAQSTVCHHLRRMGVIRSKREAQMVRYKDTRLPLIENGHGYYMVFAPDHPNARADGYILQHRYVMSRHLGRPLEKYEVVHHINGDTRDNRIENLRLMKHGEHTVITTEAQDTDEKLLQALRDLAARLGRPPAASDCTAKNGLRSVPVYVRRFGSWNRAKVLAGIGFSKTGPRSL